jgi:hypothetical protein
LRCHWNQLRSIFIISGVYPSSVDAVRVHSDGSGEFKLEKGPFSGPSIGGYAVINVTDIDEAVELVKGFGAKQAGSLEIRKILNLEELPIPDEQKATGRKIRYGIRAN